MCLITSGNAEWHIQTTTSIKKTKTSRQTGDSSWLSMSPWQPPNIMTSPSLKAVAVCHRRGRSLDTPRSRHCSDSTSNNHRSPATHDTQGVTRPASTVPGWKIDSSWLTSAADHCNRLMSWRVPQKEHERVSETVFLSLDRVSGTLCLSHYVTEISHLYSLRDFWRHFGLCRAAAHSDCCFFAPCINILTYLLTLA